MSNKHAPRNKFAAKVVFDRGLCPVTGKVSYMSRADAKQRRNQMLAGNILDHKVRPFLCVHCDMFHLGCPDTMGGITTREDHRCLARIKGP